MAGLQGSCGDVAGECIYSNVSGCTDTSRIRGGMEAASDMKSFDQEG